MNATTQVSECETKLSKKELREEKLREVAAKIAEKRQMIEELKAMPACIEVSSKFEIEKDEVPTDTGSASEEDSGYDSESSEEASALSVTAKAFYPPPPGLEFLSPGGLEEEFLQSPPGLEEEFLQSPPGLEVPIVSQLSADAKPFNYDVVRTQTKLTARAR